jgi:HEAT repeat protein
MAKRLSIEAKLAQLNELDGLDEARLAPDSVKMLRQTMAGANNILVAKAAKIAGRRGIDELIPALLAAFDRFMKKPVKSDKGCLAKEAVIDALDKLEYDRTDIFLRGIKHEQIEPAYLRPVDTAAVMRGKCAFALVRLGSPDIVFELTDLLADPEPQARIAAARALAGVSGEQGEPLLRLKAKLGDDDLQVVVECLSVLMQINPERSMTFVEAFLNSTDLIIAENAAFALAESRREEAFEVLRRHRESNMDPVFQDMLLTPMAITRLEEAFDYLLDVIENGSRESAVDAVRAVKIFSDEGHRSRIHAAVTSRNDPEIALGEK